MKEGWQVRRKNKNSLALTRDKPKHALLESRVWTLLYRMGFDYLSGDRGGQVEISPGDPKSPKQQVDVVALDQEIALSIECKSFRGPRKDPDFAEKLSKHASIRKEFADSVKKQFPSDSKRLVGSILFTWDIRPTENDLKRAEQQKVRVFNEKDLEYFEVLVKHVGPAARYQLLSEVFRGRRIHGLEIVVPALLTRMGGFTCYSFAIRPEYLLKIAYVAHRAQGKPIDLDAYQRMISRSRLKKIGEYITGDGIFPTNIVINVEKEEYLQFDRGRQEGDGAGGTFGWLTLTPAYGSAWIIDGQHRLYAYSGHSRSETSYLNVLAFGALEPTVQTQLFVDINSEQRRVKRSLLVELDSTLKWGSDDESQRIHAIVSKASMCLDDESESPLKERILLADVRRTKKRCVSLTAVASALSKPGFFVVSRKRGFTQHGPFWRDDPTSSLRRTVKVLISWLGTIAENASDWWDLGLEEGGGLATNDGVTVCINVLRSVLEHLGPAEKLGILEDSDLIARLNPYATKLGHSLGRMSLDERVHFRGLRGVEGQTTGTRICQELIRKDFSNFSPEGLEDWMERKKHNTNDQARKLIDNIEKTLQEEILKVLKEEYDADETAWWFEGVPTNVRKKVDDRINEAGGGQREENFDFIHYEAILKKNWDVFKMTFAFGGGIPGKDRGIPGKDKGTAWLRGIATMRNSVSHASRRDYVSFEDLAKLEIYNEWLEGRVTSVGLNDREV